MKNSQTNQKTQNQRTPSQAEKECDTQFISTHKKNIYTFTKDELTHIRMLETIATMMGRVSQEMINASVVGAKHRAGAIHPESKTLYSSIDGIFIVYTPKEEKHDIQA